MRIPVVALGKYWSVGWRFLIVGLFVFAIARRIRIPTLVCQIPIVREATLEIVDIREQIEEIDRHSSKIQFLGPRDEIVPERLKLPEWDKMEYVEPDFIIP